VCVEVTRFYKVPSMYMHSRPNVLTDEKPIKFDDLFIFLIGKIRVKFNNIKLPEDVSIFIDR
jgi:hypothetical protein